MTNNTQPIDPEKLSTRIDRLRSTKPKLLSQALSKSPRLIEVFWHIEWASKQPSGISGFVEDVVAANPQCIGTPGLVAGKSDVAKLLTEFPERILNDLLGEDLAYWFRFGCSARALRSVESDSWLGMEPSQGDLERARTLSKAGLDGPVEGWFAAVKAKVDRISLDQLRQVCGEEAPALIEEWLMDLLLNERDARSSEDFGRIVASAPRAELAGTILGRPDGVWCFQGLLDACLRAIDAHADQVLAQFAPTSVLQQIKERLDYVTAEQSFTWIEGSPRIGKTTALKAYCEAYPGRLRYVAVPSCHAELEFMRALARAFGIECLPGTSINVIREQLSYVIQTSSLGLVLDEGHFLYPIRYAPHSSPERLEWVRVTIRDRGVPCAVCATPQATERAEQRFVTRTRYPMAQWLGRWVNKLKLPEVLTIEDLTGVAVHFFPALNVDDCEEIAGRAAMHAGYLEAIQEVARWARFRASKLGRKAPTRSDIFAALDEILPATGVQELALAVAAPARPEASKNRVARGAGKAAAPRMQSPRREPASSFAGMELAAKAD